MLTGRFIRIPWTPSDSGEVDVDEIIERLAVHGSLEGDLSARYSRLRQRMPAVEPRDWLYYAGAVTMRRCPNAARCAGEVIKRVGIPAGVMRFEAISGQDLLAAGLEAMARTVAARVSAEIRSIGACGIICGSPRDAWMFSTVYPQWDMDPGVPVTQASVFLGTLIMEGLIELDADDLNRRCFFHGSITDPRWLRHLPALERVMDTIFADRWGLAEETQSFCLPLNEERGWPSVPDEELEPLVENLWEALEDSGADMLVTDEPVTYELLYDRADGTGIRVLDFCQLVSEHVAVIQPSLAAEE